MGKLTSYLLGLTAALSLSYYVLSVFYQPLINWIGPVVGSAIIFPFSFLFLLLGNLLTYNIILASWVIIGVVVGIGSRKGTKAVGAAIGVYSSIWGFLGLSALAVYEKFTGSSLTGTSIGSITATGTSLSIPPLPPGVTVSSILSEPLFQSLSSIFSSLPGISTLTGGTAGTTSPTAAIGSFITLFTNTLLPYMIVNLAVFLTVAGLTGMLLHKAINRGAAPREPGKRNGEKKPVNKKVKVKKTKVKKVVRKVKPNGLIIPVSLAAIILATLMVFSTGANMQNSSGNTILNAPFHQSSSNENALNSSMAAGNLILSQATKLSSNSVSPVFASYNIEAIFNSLEQDGILSSTFVNSLQSNNYYNLIPQTVIIEAYAGTVSNTSSVAQQAADALSVSLGGYSPHNFLSINLPVTGPQTISLFGYSLDANAVSSEKTITESLKTYFPQDGMLSAFMSGISSGYLIPGQTQGSVDASIFMAGFADLSQLPSSLSSFTGITNSTGTTSGSEINFMGGLFLKQNVYHSSAASHNITGTQVFNYNGNITFSSNQSVYAMSIMYPGSNMSGSSGVSGYNMLVYSNYGNLTPIGAAGNTSLTIVNSGQQFSLSNIGLPTNVTFPAQIKVSQSVVETGTNMYKVSITLMNNDTDVLQNVVINAAPIIGSYGSNIVVVSGTTKVTAAAIQPGQSVTMTYDVSFSGVGTYAVATPLFNYTLNNSTFSVIGNTLTANAQSPSIFHAVNQLELVSFTSLSSLIKFPYLVQSIYPGIYVFDLIVLLVVVLDVYLEIRAFRKWKASGKNREQDPPPPPETEEKDESE